MEQKHADEFRRNYKLIGSDKCHERAESAAKHLLVSIAFRETSIMCHLKTNSVLLPPIGYYYSIFHMAISLSWLNPKITNKNLNNIGHRSLQNLLDLQFVQPKLLSNSFLQLFQTLKEEREWTNYSFGEYAYDFDESVTKNKDHTGEEFDNAINLIHEICKEASTIYDFLQRIRTYIADSKGEDLLQTYLSDEEHDNIMTYLVKKGLSN